MFKYFIIFSAGATATKWIAASLGKHPDIFCSHGYTYPPSQAKSKEYTLDELRKLRKDKKRFYKISPENYFNELSSNINKKFLGCIHLFTISEYSKFCISLKKKINTAHIYRNPILRVTAIYQHAKKFILKDHILNDEIESWLINKLSFNKDSLTFLSSINKDLKNLSLDDKCFIFAVGVVMSASGNILEAYDNNIKQFKFELLTTSKEYRNKFLNTITEGIENSDFFLNKKINKHRVKNFTPKQQFEEWINWKQNFFRINFFDYRNLYINKLDYDLNFI